MIPVESQALEGLRRVLGLGGSGSGAMAAVTEFDDAVLQQILEVTPIVRRGRTLAPSEGIYAAEMFNAHVGVGILHQTIDPFAVAATAAGYPSPIPPGFDLYLIKTFVTLLAAGLFNDAMLRVTYPVGMVPFGTSNDVDFPYAIYNTEITICGIIFGGSSAVGVTNVVQGRPLRLQRGNLLEFSSQATAALTVVCGFVLGLFPSALGQDIE